MLSVRHSVVLRSVLLHLAPDKFVPPFHSRQRCHLPLFVLLFSLLASSQFASVGFAQSSPSPVLAIHAGGSAAGNFAADEDYSGGSPAGTSSAVDTSHAQNPAPQSVYQTQRYGPSTYTLPGLTPGAAYTLRLHFAEIYYGLSNPGGGGVGKRAFNVSVNGQQVLTNFDIYAVAGHENTAVIKQFPTTADASGNVTVAFTFGNTDQPEIAGIEVLAGAPAPTVSSIAVSPSSPILHTGGLQQFTATASDQYGNPLASQPSFTWSVASGVGTISSAGLYSAGSAVGTAQVQASSGGVSGSATASVSTGSIAGSGATLSSGQSIDLTALGPLDWAHWGLNGAQDKNSGEFDHKAASGTTPVGLISNYSGVGGAAAYTDSRSAVNFSWSDGTPTHSVTNTSDIYVEGYNSLSFSVPADTTSRILTVFVGGSSDYATLTAHLSDNSSADFVDSSFGYDKPGNLDGVNYQAAYTLKYQAASAGQTLTVTWTQTHSDASYAQAQLQGAALALASTANPVLTSIVVSPASATIGTKTTQPYAATALDQNGNPLAPQPAFTWSVASGVGTISSSGVYSAGASAGTATVQAASGSIHGQATVTVRVPVGRLFSTGVDSSGNLLADGAADPHYSITSGPDGAGNAALVTLTDHYPLPFYWLPSSGSSKWVSPQADQSSGPEPPGAYVYKTTFDLTGLDPGSVQISGQMLVDDQVTDVHLNGVSLGLTAPYNTWVPVNITSGFQAGVNTLEFLVTNLGTSNNPSGLQVQLTGTGNASAPAPVLTSIAVSPTPVTLNVYGQQQFTATAYDQNGNALSPQPAFTWTVPSGSVGNISATGLYSAGTTAGSATVTATSGAVSGTASVTVAAAPPGQFASYLYVSYLGGSTVDVVDPVTFQVVKTFSGINASNGTYGITASADGKKIYTGRGTLYALDSTTGTLLANVPAPVYGLSLTTSPDGSRIYGADGYGGYVVYDANSLNVLHSQGSGGGDANIGATLIAVSPDNQLFAVCNISGGIVTIYRATDYSAVATTSMQYPYGCVFSRDGKSLYVTEANEGSTNSVVVISTSTGKITNTLPVGFFPEDIAISPDGSKVFAVNDNSSFLSVINTANQAVANSGTTGYGGDSIAYSADGQHLYTAVNGNLLEIDPSTLQVTRQLAVNGIVEGLTTALASVSNTPASLYLSNLTITSTAVTGGNGTTGTVTLSGPAVSDITVALHSDNSTVTVPATCTIAAGATQAIFNITTTPVSTITTATLSGASNGWTQAANLTLLPSSQSFDIQGLTSAPGNGCALLFWTDLPGGSIRGYNVYRVNGTTNTLLTTSLQQAPFYADTGLVNGTTYQYAVSAVDFQGQEHPLSSSISVVPSSTLGILSWGAFPSPISDFVTLYASLDSATIPSFTILLVDGKEFGSGDSPAISTGSNSVGGNVEAGLDTTELSNGNHVIQLIGWLDENTVCATPPQTISVSNSVSNFTYDDTIDPGAIDQINATMPSSASWTVSITNDDTGSIIRTWQGASALLHLAWDGTDSTGTPVPEGTYAATISAGGANGAATPSAGISPHSAGTVGQKVRLYRLKTPPQGLAMIDKTANDPAKDEALRARIQSDFDKMAANNPGFVGYSISADKRANKSLAFGQKIANWLGLSVVDLYISSHGGTGWLPNNTSYTHLEMHYANLVFFAPQFTHGSKMLAFRDADDKRHVYFDITVLTQLRQQNGASPYNFVMMDGCYQGGGSPGLAPNGKGYPIDNIGPVNNLWGKVFGVGTDPEAVGGCFLGWNGESLTTDSTNWFNWECTLWDGLAINGETVQLAIDQANATVHYSSQDAVTFWDGSSEIIEPTDQNRLNAFGFPGQTLLP